MRRKHHARAEPTLEDALKLAAEAHRGQVYPSPDPEPFILHPLRVMLGVTSRVAQIVAVLHDVVEDTSVTLSALEKRGFGRPILDAVDCLSHRPGEAYEDYIHRLAADPIARQVKLSDLFKWPPIVTRYAVPVGSIVAGTGTTSEVRVEQSPLP